MLRSYHNDKKLKKIFVDEIVSHRKAGAIIQGIYKENVNGQFKGGAVGCSIHSLNQKLDKQYCTNDYSAYEDLIGVPEWLAWLEDTIFEGLPSDEANLWPESFAKAIPVGVNLETVKWKFCAFLIKENIERVLTLEIDDSLKEQVVDAISQVLSLHETATGTGEWNESAAESARSTAESAVESARLAWLAAESTRSAAGSAVESAESAESHWSAWLAAESTRSVAAAAESAMEALLAVKSAAESAESHWSAWLAAARSAESAWSARSAAGSAEVPWLAWVAAESAGELACSAAYQRYAKELLRLLKAVNKEEYGRIKDS